MTTERVSRWFWPVQCVAWAAYGLQQYLGVTGLFGESGGSGTLATLDALQGFALTAALRMVYRSTWTWPAAPRIAAGVTAFGLAVGAYSFLYTRTLAALCDRCTLPDSPLGYVGSLGSAAYLLLAWSGGYFGVRLAVQLRHERETSLRLDAAAHLAQLRMLRYQLNPHFLFNALNALSTRALECHDEVGERMVDALSQFLRYALDADPDRQVPLAEEVAAMRRYLEIEQARFGDRLRVRIEVADDALAVPVPGLLLQPLVENAVKHGVVPREAGGRIQVGARCVGMQLAIEVADDGPGSDDYDGGTTAVGLANVRERLRLLYGDRQRFEIGRVPGGGTVARIGLPLPGPA